MTGQRMSSAPYGMPNATKNTPCSVVASASDNRVHVSENRVRDLLLNRS